MSYGHFIRWSLERELPWAQTLSFNDEGPDNARAEKFKVFLVDMKEKLLAGPRSKKMLEIQMEFAREVAAGGAMEQLYKELRLPPNANPFTDVVEAVSAVPCTRHFLILRCPRVYNINKF